MTVWAEALKTPTIVAAMERPYDNFALIRLGLALAVVVSHAFSVTTGVVSDEPLAAMGFTLGEHAVNGFFAVSGFLVTMSYDRRGWRDYVIARTLRIAPGFIVATLIVALVFGAALTRLPVAEYWRDPGLWRFITATLTTFKSSAVLPGVFEANPFKFPIGTVWTLKYEVLCYVGVLLLGLSGLLRLRMVVLILVAELFCAVAGLDAVRPDAPKGLQTMLRLPLVFFLGSLLYLWRDRVHLSIRVLASLTIATALLRDTFLCKALLFTAESYGVLWLALTSGLLHSALDLKSDFSYGTYLYGWPVQQALHQLFPTASALSLLGPSLVLTLAIAALSWFLVERPALALKFRSLGRRTLKTIEPAAP